MVEKIFAMGDDALANLFDISLAPIPFIDDLTSTIVRVQNFTIPATGAGTYEVHHKTQKITKPSGKIEAPNEFNFDIRVDRNWLVYKGLILWKNAVANSYTGVIGPDNLLSNNRVNITAWAVTPENLPIPSFGNWNFKGCFPMTVGDVGFDYSSGDPIIVNVTFGFLAMDDNII